MILPPGEVYNMIWSYICWRAVVPVVWDGSRLSGTLNFFSDRTSGPHCIWYFPAF